MFDIIQEEDYRELTLDEQYLVNGGKDISNSIEAQAGADVGDTLTREDGTTWTLTQGDINWAQKVMAERNGSDTQGTGTGGSSSGGGSSSNSSSGKKHSSGTDGAGNTINSPRKRNPYIPGNYDPNEPDTDKRYAAKDYNGEHFMTVNPEDLDRFVDTVGYYLVVGQYGTADTVSYDGIAITDRWGRIQGIVRTEKEVKELSDKIDKSEGNIFAALSDFFGNISTSSFMANKGMNYIIDNAEEIADVTKIAVNTSKLAKYTKIASNVSNVTGYLGVACDVGEVIRKPTLQNMSNVVTGAISMVPGYFLLGAGCAALTETIGAIARPCIQIATIYNSKVTAYESIIESHSGTSISELGQLGRNVFRSGMLQGLNFFFSKD